MSDELQPVVINLNANKEETINESWLAMFGGAIEMILKQMFSGNTGVARGFRTSVRGTPTQVAAFGDALSKEKRYMESFLKYGLNDPRSFSSKADLNKAIANFEKETSIKWPFN
jgi:hypothetical protein|tara:strand:- start:818 stop:1159 length:342 start_codon:yes stop_codon:yes gene_type:complete